MKRPEDHDYPEFGEIMKILLHEDAKYLLLKQYFTVSFSHHYYSYEVEPTTDYKLTPIGSIALHQVFHKYCVNSGCFVVVVRSCDHVELFV